MFCRKIRLIANNHQDSVCFGHILHHPPHARFDRRRHACFPARIDQGNSSKRFYGCRDAPSEGAKNNEDAFYTRLTRQPHAAAKQCFPAKMHQLLRLPKPAACASSQNDSSNGHDRDYIRWKGLTETTGASRLSTQPLSCIFPGRLPAHDQTSGFKVRLARCFS